MINTIKHAHEYIVRNILKNFVVFVVNFMPRSHGLRGNAVINAPALTAYHLSLLFLCVDTTLVRLLLRYHAVRGNEAPNQRMEKLLIRIFLNFCMGIIDTNNFDSENDFMTCQGMIKIDFCSIVFKANHSARDFVTIRRFKRKRQADFRR